MFERSLVQIQVLVIRQYSNVLSFLLQFFIREVVTVAKGKYEKWLKEENLLLLEGWARDGLTDEQIAKNIGITVSTFYEWKKKYSEISESLKKGKEVVDYQVENALLLSALDGNTTAQIFWLKNRRPDKWRDKPKDEADTTALDKLDNILKEIKEDAERSKDNAVHE